MGQAHSQPQLCNLESAQEKGQYRVAVICGSLRRASTNGGLIKSIYEARDKRFYFVWIDISQFPVFNEDIQANGYPTPVQKARNLVGQADAILFAVPEYNFTISSPLKNAYDWLSREDKQKFCPVLQKIGAMVSSGGGSGGAKAQEHFRQCVQFRKLKILKPSKDAQLLVKRWSGNIFDPNGNLVDPQVKKRIPIFLNEFYQFIKETKK